MYICLCNGFTDEQISSAAMAGVRSVKGLFRCLGAQPQCGLCIPDVEELLQQSPAPTVSMKGGGAAAARME